MTKRLSVLALICLLFLGSATFLHVGAALNVIVVPDNYPSVSQALAHAVDGDVIYVRNGVYNDSAWTINKAITICGEDVKNTKVTLTPKFGSIYSPYFNRSYNFPADAITINASNVQIRGTTLTSTGGITGIGDGIRLVSNILTLGQTVGLTGFGGNCNITGFGTTIERNTLNGDDWRMTGDKLTLAENTINVNHHVGFLSNGSCCNISGNSLNGDLIIWGSMNTIAHNSYDLLFIFGGDSNTIRGNLGEISFGNSDLSCSNNIVSGNIMNGSAVWGIWIGQFCNNNVFFDNYIENEGYAADGWDYNSGVIFCNQNGCIGTNNTFYHNMFVNNSVNVKFYTSFPTSGNFWDKGLKGNYWSDYEGSDANGDGVGDTPYVINSGNIDNYPLSAPFDAPVITIEPPIYDPPISESLLPQSVAVSPISTPTSTPESSGGDEPTQHPYPLNGLSSLFPLLDLATDVVIVLFSVAIIVAIFFILKLRKLSGPDNSN